jgi:hypothetical protein
LTQGILPIFLIPIRLPPVLPPHFNCPSKVLLPVVTAAQPFAEAKRSLPAENGRRGLSAGFHPCNNLL